MRSSRVLLSVLVVLLLAGTGTSRAEEDIGYRGWGFRVGLGSEPDQAVAGFQWDLGRIIPKLRFQPNLEVGGGDDTITVFGAAAVHYMFELDSKFTPYAGGSFVLGVARVDTPGRTDTTVEGGVRAIGGFQWPRRSGKPLAIEVNIGFGDIHDFQAKFVYTF